MIVPFSNLSLRVVTAAGKGGRRYDQEEMGLLVDGYNVLYTDMPVNLAGLDEVGLCVLLSRSIWAKGPITVVYDGKVKPHGPARSPVAAVKLVYSGPDRSADEVIISAIDADSAPRRLLVVSTDRQIQKAARRRRCQIMDSMAFVHHLAKGWRSGVDHQGQQAGGEFTKPLDGDEVQQWLKYFDISPEDRPRNQE